MLSVFALMVAGMTASAMGAPPAININRSSLAVGATASSSRHHSVVLRPEFAHASSSLTRSGQSTCVSITIGRNALSHARHLRSGRLL